MEDQSDRDGDGNYLEPDGVIDHLVLVHANQGKSRGGGDVGVYAVWAHSSTVAGGYTIPGTDLKVSNYIVQPEDAGVGVFAHEFGHDLGLPDLYDTSGNADSDVDFWDLMASGSHSGEIFQALPTHMGLWDKWVLGWAEPKTFGPGDRSKLVKLGQTSRTPVGTEDGIKIDLPDKVISLATPHSGSNMWYSGADQNWADVKLSRTVTVPNAADAKFWMWNDYVIEADWDYGFVEVSTDGGTTWTEQKVYAEGGALVSTNDGYADPNGRMVDFGNKKYGLTGSTDGWRHDYVDLSSYAGQTVQVRLRYATDEAFVERGWFADDFSVTGGGATTWSDDVESGAAGWTQTGGTFTDTSGAGWYIDSGTQVKSHYYLAEWRNFDGFDKGLKYTYDTVYSHEAWKVDRIAYNAPGMLVWYRDTQLGDVNHVTAQMTALPSYGAKGGLLIVDSHNDPCAAGVAAEKDPSVLKNLPSRPQSSNAAFGLKPTYPFKSAWRRRTSRTASTARSSVRRLRYAASPTPRAGTPASRSVTAPRTRGQRRLGGRPVAGQPAVHDPGGEPGRHPGDRLVRRGTGRRGDRARHRQPARLGRPVRRLDHHQVGRQGQLVRHGVRGSARS
ncbi:M6 family metalloprotease domain-containing protein [Micromonospora sp. b486]|uniref:M6 family metalloprotease domain-containing protein n=1 Tax=Micromonospora sp. b486 TaxID=3053986 RepID=UPI00259C74DF|nr:M6 family metalloprotease domain-containing protein [Micromonospora sp. b486]MDM4784484.1 immune inhibitor A [Micromonospora sp. b486]